MSFHVRVTPITELPSRPLFSNPSGARVPCAIDNATRIEVDAASQRHRLPSVKILLAPFGSRGDVYPMIALAQRLEREGHDVLIAGLPDQLQPVEPQTGERAPRRARDGSACRYLFRMC